MPKKCFSVRSNEPSTSTKVGIYLTAFVTIYISVENPYHLLDVPRVKTFINAYSSTNQVLTGLIEKLTGKSSFMGKSPVDAFCGRWDTKL
jgi:beta-N-acetylhexosaminidase